MTLWLDSLSYGLQACKLEIRKQEQMPNNTEHDHTFKSNIFNYFYHPIPYPGNRFSMDFVDNKHINIYKLKKYFACCKVC